MPRRRRAIFTTAHPRDVIDQTEKLAGKIEWGYVNKGLATKVRKILAASSSRDSRVACSESLNEL